MTARVLLDTHLLLWALAAPSRLPAGARRLIDASEVHVSAASIWEVSIKAALGRLAAKSHEVLAAVEPAGFELLPITGEHAAEVARLPMHHRDPFDRMLIAQARVEGMRLLSNDDVLQVYGDSVVIA